ncbi:CD206 [Mytilus edulis]|uniref:MRC n=1 Tax=Mytilus edulis TaxID=6550 RepID=A0A8S3SBV2_MYTED|nr:CD206 [Mytilus edulis]
MKSLEEEFKKIKSKLDIIGKKIKTLNSDFTSLGKFFKISERNWYKFKGHCYYYSTNLTDWFTAENNCRKIGGYLVKINEKAENEALSTNRPLKKEHYWIGLTDLTEGQYRWIHDQTKATYLPWYSGYGALGTKHNCVMFHRQLAQWADYLCEYKWRYICERNHCF